MTQLIRNFAKACHQTILLNVISVTCCLEGQGMRALKPGLNNQYKLVVTGAGVSCQEGPSLFASTH